MAGTPNSVFPPTFGPWPPTSTLWRYAGQILVTVPASSTRSLPGPSSPSRLRVYDTLWGVPQTAVNLVGARLDLVQVAPGPTLVWRNFPASSTSAPLNGPVLGFGESVNCVNGAGPVLNVIASYYEIPAVANPSAPGGGLTLVRQQFGVASTPVIPTPPQGWVRRWLQFPNAQQATREVACKIHLVNPDTVGHSVEASLGADVVFRIGAVAALGANSSAGFGAQIIVRATDPPFQYRTPEAVVTTGPIIYGVYETVGAGA